MRTYAKRIAGSKSRRGAVALEYILIASLVAIALMGAFLYFRRTLDTSVRAMTDVAGKGMAESITEANTALESKEESGHTKGLDFGK